MLKKTFSEQVRFISLIETTRTQSHKQVILVNPTFMEAMRTLKPAEDADSISWLSLSDWPDSLTPRLLIAQSIQHILHIAPMVRSWAMLKRFSPKQFFAPLHQDDPYYLHISRLLAVQRGRATSSTHQLLRGASPSLQQPTKRRFSHLHSLDGQFWFHPLSLPRLRFLWSKAWRTFIWLPDGQGSRYGLNSQFVASLMPSGKPADKNSVFSLVNGEVYKVPEVLPKLHRLWRKKQTYLLSGFTHEGLPVVVNPSLMSYVSCTRHIIKDDRVVWRSHVTYLLKTHTDVLNLPLKQLFSLPFFIPMKHTSPELRVFINLHQVSRIQTHDDGTLITFADDNLFMPCTQPLEKFYFLTTAHHFKLFHTPTGDEILVNLNHVRLARATLIEPNDTIGTQLQFSKFYDTLDITEPLDSLL